MSKHYGTSQYIDVDTNEEGFVVIRASSDESGEEAVTIFTPDDAAALAGEILRAALKSGDNTIVGLSIMGIRENGEVIDLGCTCE